MPDQECGLRLITMRRTARSHQINYKIIFLADFFALHSNVHETTLALETPMPFILSPSATFKRALSKDEFAEIIVCIFQEVFHLVTLDKESIMIFGKSLSASCAIR
jgi:hypothetical protein